MNEYLLAYLFTAPLLCMDKKPEPEIKQEEKKVPSKKVYVLPPAIITRGNNITIKP